VQDQVGEHEVVRLIMTLGLVARSRPRGRDQMNDHSLDISGYRIRLIDRL